MKNLGLMLACLLAGGAGVFAQQMVSLDEAITTGAREIEADLKTGVKVAVLNFSSPSGHFSSYVLDEIMNALVKGKKLVVVDRANIDLIQDEMNFQMSGQVSDSSAQVIGRKLGAQSIISGSVENMGDFYRIRFKALEVATAAVQSSTSLNVRKDTQATALMQSSGGKKTGTLYENGLNFSTGEKAGAGFQNMLFGWGSFSMGDIAGGRIIAGFEVVGTLFVTDLFSFRYRRAYALKVYAGIGLLSAGVIYGFFRPFIYDKKLAIKNGTYTAQEKNPMKHIVVAILPDTKQNPALGLVYRTAW